MKKAFGLMTLLCSFLLFTNAQNGFVKVKNHQFTLNDKPYYYIGTNYWYGGLLPLIKDPVRGRERLIRELDFLQQNGIKNLRVLAGVEGSGLISGISRVSPALQTKQGVFEKDILVGLDILLAEMGKRGLKAVIYLSNNWEWSGGFMQYLNWNGVLPEATMRKKMTWDEQRDITSDFYRSEPSIQAYLNQVKFIITRVNSITHQPYTKDPAIMAWELANEPRPMRPAAIPFYKEFISNTAHQIRSMDPNHLITIGSEGDIGSENMATYEAVHAGKNIDYLTIHIWPKNWAWFSDTSIAKGFPTVIANTASFIDKHVQVANKLSKPLVIEEFGMPRDLHSFAINTTTYMRDQYYQYMFGRLTESIGKTGPLAGCNFWGFAGQGRANPAHHYWWKDGDDYTVDPPMEEQGMNSVFDSDKSTWDLIQRFTNQIRK